MKIIVAPDKFKGSLSAKDVAKAVIKGLKEVLPDVEIDSIPMADGGEGTVDAITTARGGRKITREVTGPLGQSIAAQFTVFTGPDGVKTAAIEMAAASGISLAVGRNRPMQATTYGTGELILAALDRKCRRLIIGLGGSATTDGGCGMAQALGARFTDLRGRPLKRGGRELSQLRELSLGKMDSRLGETEVLAACDVDSGLYGKRGAAFEYAPQKGATQAQVEMLDAGLRRLSKTIKASLGLDVHDMPGAGAAGGLGAGLVAFAGARLCMGVDVVSEVVELSDRMTGADLVITGEGRLDKQTFRGKAPYGVAGIAKSLDIPTVAIVGSIDVGTVELQKHGILAAAPICARPMTGAEAEEDAAKLITAAAKRVLSIFLAGHRLGHD